jgi:hypothetical protein
MLLIAYTVVLFGSGPLLRAFRTDEALITESATRAFRKELSFGSTLMFFGVLVASFFIAVVPDWYAKPAIIGFPILMLAFLLLSSRRIFDSMREIAGGPLLPDKVRVRSGDPATPDILTEATNLLTVPAAFDTADLTPPSVTEPTTRHLARRTTSGELN